MVDILGIKNKIIKKFQIYCILVNMDAKEWLTDNNRYAQDFFVELWNALWSLNLENADYLKKNQDTFDLIDKKSSLVVQVTSQTDKAKVEKTLEGFFDKYIDKYSKLKIWLIWERKKYNTDFKKYSSFFNKDEDIIDLNTVVTNIRNISETEKLLKIKNIIDWYFQINLDSFSFEDINKSLNYLKSYLEKKSCLKVCEKLKTDEYRIWNSTYLIKKDLLNWVDESLYKDDIQYWIVLDSYLKSDDYWRWLYNSIAYSLNYLINESDLNSVLTDIIQITYAQKGILNSLIIVLDNMYFNCDIWKNPNDFNR